MVYNSILAGGHLDEETAIDAGDSNPEVRNIDS